MLIKKKKPQDSCCPWRGFGGGDWGRSTEWLLGVWSGFISLSGTDDASVIGL